VEDDGEAREGVRRENGTEGRGNKAAKDDGDAREGVRRENTGRRSGRSGSSRCRRSSARGTQLAAQPLRFIQDVILKKCRAVPHAQADAIEILGALPAGHNGPGRRAATGREVKKLRTRRKHRGRHLTGGYGPNGEIVPQLGGRHKN
jgi:hypothetical protein